MDRNLACSGSEFKTDSIIFYDKKIPYLEIIKILRKYEEKQLSEELTKAAGIEISLEGDVMNLDEVAKRHGISVEVLKKVINRGKGDYLLFGDQPINQQTLRAIKSELSGVRKHNEAVKIFEKYGIKGHCLILEFLGYRVKWSGLDPENAEIVA